MKRIEIKYLNCLYSLLAGMIFSIMLFACPAYASDDNFIRGYAASVMEREFNLSPASLTVSGGVIYLSADDITGADGGALITDLLKIKGVEIVEILEAGQNLPEGTSGAPGGGETVKEVRHGMDRALPGSSSKTDRLFDPLIADPRWPNFSGAYHYYIQDDDLEKVFAASVGDVIPMYTADVPFAIGGKWQFGGEAGAFVIHDLNTTSWDQVNSDYLFGMTLAYRKDSTSGIFRVFHLSSHIGDEYLLHNNVDRENYSYEAFGLMISEDIKDWLRFYYGGEYRFSRSPKELRPLAAQYGAELKSPRTYGIFRPIAALNMKHNQDNNWSAEISLKAGVQVVNKQMGDNNFRLMLGYFNGHSPNGQFYKQSEQLVSCGFYYNY